MTPGDARRTGLAARRALSRRQRRAKSKVICRRIAGSPAYRRARVVAAYVALDDEVDLQLLMTHSLATGRTVCVPVVTAAGRLRFHALDGQTILHRHALGVLQPRQPTRYGSAAIARARIDLLCAPMSAFDTQNNRTGMGGGYYDRFLAGKKGRRSPRIFGVAFACQEVSTIDAAPWDVPVEQVITEQFARYRRGNQAR